MADTTAATTEKAPNVATQPHQEMSFIHPEPPMAYQPPAYQPPSKSPDAIASAQPIHERGPRMVTRLEKVGSQPADVDCPYCRKVVRTRVAEVSSGDDSMMQCLICLVCWPMLFCYEGNKDLEHWCTVCGKKLTHTPHGSGVVQVVAQENAAVWEQSKYEQRAE